MACFEIERDGQLEFYRTFLPLINPDLTLDDILNDNNDGVLNGNLIEFKLRVGDLNTVLFQSIKYLSSLRIKGKPIPANIVLVDLNAEAAYLYHSDDYLADIEKVYPGGASKDNCGFIGKAYNEKYAYGSSQVDAANLIARLKENNHTRIHIDENCIVGWAMAYYRLVPTARKEDFIGDNTGRHRKVGEIRSPSVFSEYILPYKGDSNIRFEYLMDCLNDFLQKKNLGAFYTPKPYAEKARELLRKAIDRVPEGNDYIILDRCAGTGNLEKGLSDEELGHCVLSTIEYYEYKVMQEVLGSKVRHIIPPVEAGDTFRAGLVKGADALSHEYVENPLIRQYLDNPNCTIILFENPPYAETTSMEHQKRGVGKKSSAGWKGSWVVGQMSAAVKRDKSVESRCVNDMGNAFIWSGFEYYLRQPTDSYVLFSPPKYWKSQGLVKKRLIEGFACDRAHFHARKHSCVLVALWANEDSAAREFTVPGYDIVDGKLGAPVQLEFKMISERYSQRYYDKRKFENDVEGGILLQRTGTEAVHQKRSLKPCWNDNIIGYMVVDSSGFDSPELHAILISAGMFNGHGFYLRRDNFLEKLPMFAASRYISYNGSWTERGRVMKSADGAEGFMKAMKQGSLRTWLRRVLLFTCCEYQNHMRSFMGSDGRAYRNEICLDTTNGPTAASEALSTLSIQGEEKELIEAWECVLTEAKRTAGYDPTLTYGLYQIGEELNTWTKSEDNGEIIYDYPELNGAIRSLKELNKEFYLKKVVPNLFKYEFLK